MFSRAIVLILPSRFLKFLLGAQPFYPLSGTCAAVPELLGASCRCVIKVTCRPAAGRDLRERRTLGAAAGKDEWTARMEVAARRRIERRGDLALDGLKAMFPAVEPR